MGNDLKKQIKMRFTFQIKKIAVNLISIAHWETCNVSHGFGYVMVIGIVSMVVMKLKHYVVCFSWIIENVTLHINCDHKLQVIGSAVMKVSNATLECLLV